MKKTVFWIITVAVFALIAYTAVTNGIEAKRESDYARAFSAVNDGEVVIKTGEVYFNRLTRREQYIYERLYESAIELEEYTERIPFIVEEAELRGALDALSLDKPELFYLDYDSFTLDDYIHVETKEASLETTITEHKTFDDGKYTTLHLVFTDSRENMEIMRARLDASAEKADVITSGLRSDFEKQVVLHDYLTTVCAHAQPGDVDTSSTSYGALVNGRADSEGYAKAFKLLLNRCGIISHICYGTVIGSPGVWNIVLIDDKFYNTDVYENDLDNTFESEAMHFVYTHAFLNASDGEIAATHKKPADAPVCADPASYFSRMSLHAKSEGELNAILKTALVDAARYKKTYIEFYCAYKTSEAELEQLVKTSLDENCPEYADACVVLQPKLTVPAYTVKIQKTATPETEG